MTLAEFQNRAQSPVNAVGAVNVIPADEDLPYVALEIEVADVTGTLHLTGADDVEVTLSEAHLTAMGGRVRFAVKRIWATGTSASGIVALR